MLNNSLNALPQAILQTVVYSDIFDYPLTAPEIHRYLAGIKASAEAVDEVLEKVNFLVRTGSYFTLPGRAAITNIRRQRAVRSRQLLPIALKYGRMLGALPFVRMVALTGSLAVMNVSKSADFDYMLVTDQGRVWTARLFAMAVNRVARLLGHTLCPNLIVSESALEWPLHDLYSARELVQMIPITGMNVYLQLLEANQWAEEFLPNALPSLRGGLRRDSTKIPTTLAPHGSAGEQSPSLHWRLLRRSRWSLLAMTEWWLSGKLGNQLEHWEMTRKIARFSKQPGFGEETIFTTEVCQGNFHHHRKWTREIYQEKLSVIASEAERNEAISSLTEIASSPIGSSQ